MKKALSRIFGQFARGAQRYNAGDRAFRELDKQKAAPVVAPKHHSNLKHLEQLEKGWYIENFSLKPQIFSISPNLKTLYYSFVKSNTGKGEFIEKSNVVDEVHDGHLKQIYVTSTDPEVGHSNPN